MRHASGDRARAKFWRAACILVVSAGDGPMDATRTFRHQHYDLHCSAKMIDGGRFTASLIACKDVWPTRPRVIAMPRGDYLTEETAIDAAHTPGIEWVLNYG